jgi:hypothetical protein
LNATNKAITTLTAVSTYQPGNFVLQAGQRLRVRPTTLWQLGHVIGSDSKIVSRKGAKEDAKLANENSSLRLCVFLCAFA